MTTPHSPLRVLNSIGTKPPEYTSIAWTRKGETVVGSRYRGIFVDEAESTRWAGPSCVLR